MLVFPPKTTWPESPKAKTIMQPHFMRQTLVVASPKIYVPSPAHSTKSPLARANCVWRNYATTQMGLVGIPATHWHACTHRVWSTYKWKLYSHMFTYVSGVSRCVVQPTIWSIPPPKSPIDVWLSVCLWLRARRVRRKNIFYAPIWAMLLL